MKAPPQLTRTQLRTLRGLGYCMFGGTASEVSSKLQSRQKAASNLKTLEAQGLVFATTREEWKKCGNDGEEKLVTVKIYKLTAAGYKVLPKI